MLGTDMTRFLGTAGAAFDGAGVENPRVRSSEAGGVAGGDSGDVEEDATEVPEVGFRRPVDLVVGDVVDEADQLFVEARPGRYEVEAGESLGHLCILGDGRGKPRPYGSCD